MLNIDSSHALAGFLALCFRSQLAERLFEVIVGQAAVDGLSGGAGLGVRPHAEHRLFTRLGRVLGVVLPIAACRTTVRGSSRSGCRRRSVRWRWPWCTTPC